jgi:hypothetical protein
MEKVYGFARLSVIGLKLFVVRSGYRIDRRTIKRGFRLSNLIISS